MYNYSFFFFFFFNDTPTTEIYTLSLHDALPISGYRIFYCFVISSSSRWLGLEESAVVRPSVQSMRSEEHTSELQSRPHLVCRLLLEKKKKKQNNHPVILITIRLL